MTVVTQNHPQRRTPCIVSSLRIWVMVPTWSLKPRAALRADAFSKSWCSPPSPLVHDYHIHPYGGNEPLLSISYRRDSLIFDIESLEVITGKHLSHLVAATAMPRPRFEFTVHRSSRQPTLEGASGSPAHGRLLAQAAIPTVSQGAWWKSSTCQFYILSA